MKRILLGAGIFFLVELLIAGGCYVYVTTTPDDSLETVVVSRAWVSKIYRERLKMIGELEELSDKVQEQQKQLALQELSRRT